MEFRVKSDFYACVLDADKEYPVTKLTFAILGLLFGMLIFGGIILALYVHRIRRKRPMVPRRNKLILDPEIEPSMLHFSFSSPTSSATYHPHELRATAAGDSTLKVSVIIFSFFTLHNEQYKKYIN